MANLSETRKPLKQINVSDYIEYPADSRRYRKVLGQAPGRKRKDYVLLKLDNGHFAQEVEVSPYILHNCLARA